MEVKQGRCEVGTSIRRVQETGRRREQGTDPRRGGKLSGNRINHEEISGTANRGYRDGSRGLEKLYVVGLYTRRTGEHGKGALATGEG